MKVAILLIVGGTALLAIPMTYPDSCREAIRGMGESGSGMPLVDVGLLAAGWMFGADGTPYVENVCTIAVGWSWYVSLLLLWLICCERLARKVGW